MGKRGTQSALMVEVICNTDVLPGMEYPYLPTDWAWEIRNIPFELWKKEQARLKKTGHQPTLRLVKDEKVVDLYVAGMTTEAYLRHWGLDLSMQKGGYLLSKRMSRLFHPYKIWSFFAADEIRIVHRPDWDTKLWDGCGCVSRRFLRELLLPTLADLPEEKRRTYEAELRATRRWEITVAHEHGEEKGDVVVFDTLPGDADFLFPAGSAKPELCQTASIFVGLATARHAKDGMRFDPQSLINLHPFLEPAQLMAWVEMESELFLEALETGRAGRVYSRLVCDEARLAKLSGWTMAEYLVSGGDLRHFASITREVGREHIRRLTGKVQEKLRFPGPGGRYYIMPAVVGEREVPRGYIELDRRYATAWVNDEDWLESLVELLGGCDGDDALWVLPFTDHDDTRQVLIWRSPNQLGEYALLRPTEHSHEIRWRCAGGEVLTWPRMDSRKLPPRVDTVDYEYLTLKEAPMPYEAPAYSVAAMKQTIRLAMANRGTLGAHCNLLMLTKALYGRLPRRLPATLETIIDGAVKRFIDLSPVKAWVAEAALAIVAQGKPVPEALLDRLLPMLPREVRSQVVVSTDHWLDELLAAVDAHCAWYEGEVEALAAHAMPPAEFFLCLDPAWKQAGRWLRQCYADCLREGGTQDEARVACETFLAGYEEGERAQILLAAAACCYTLGKHDPDGEFSDNVIWQLGAKSPSGERTPGIAHAFIQALRGIGLLGVPRWSGGGLVVGASLAEVTPGVPVTLNGTWANLLRVREPELPTRMGLIPVSKRDAAKAAIERLVDGPFIGMGLVCEGLEERLVMRTERGNLFGYVQKGHERRVAEAPCWRIAWAAADDGNVHAVLSPVA
ncbi:MAG: hypothetical protein H0T73_00495 [Ardenticatenales bacterium]|nr:hypothetical protein [Ardenticatenales bacterium]